MNNLSKLAHVAAAALAAAALSAIALAVFYAPALLICAAMKVLGSDLGLDDGAAGAVALWLSAAFWARTYGIDHHLWRALGNSIQSLREHSNATSKPL